MDSTYRWILGVDIVLTTIEIKFIFSDGSHSFARLFDERRIGNGVFLADNVSGNTRQYNKRIVDKRTEQVVSNGLVRYMD